MGKKKPNVITIFADDLGVGDVSSFNPESKIKTKNIDRLAERGMRFFDSHATSAVCSPSRYGLLTGRYNWRSRLKSFVLPGDSESLIPEGRRTIAHMLKDQGYQTAAIGKWHLGLEWQRKEENDYEAYGLDPDDFVERDYIVGRDGKFDWSEIKEAQKGKAPYEGLDIDFSKPITFGPNQLGFDYFFGTAASLDQPPYVYIENDRVVDEPDHITGMERLDRQEETDQQSWQAGVAAPGYDIQKVPDDMQDRALRVLDRFIEEDKPFFLYYPTHLVHGPLLPNEEFGGKSGIGSYGDFVLQLDHYVGEIMDRLDEAGIFEDTIFIFTSDNGASGVAEFDHLNMVGHDPSGGYRGKKFDIWEGGHREPTVVSYPGVIPEKSVSNHMISHSDFYRTIAELVEADVSEDEAEDSVSALPLVQNQEKIREDIVHSSSNGGLSIRRGFWKLILTKDSGGADVPVEESNFVPSQLYNLREDISEENNVIDDHPEIVQEMKEALAKYVKEGRSTPGNTKENDRNNPSGDWPQLAWMDDYKDYVKEFKEKKKSKGKSTSGKSK